MSFVVIWCYLTFLMLYNVVLCHLLSLYDILLNNFQPLFGLDNPWPNSFREGNNCMFQDIWLSFTAICCQVMSSHLILRHQMTSPFLPQNLLWHPISHILLPLVHYNKLFKYKWKTWGEPDPPPPPPESFNYKFNTIWIFILKFNSTMQSTAQNVTKC